MNYESIYTNIRTTAERSNVSMATETIIEALYKKDADISVLIETEMPSTIAQSFKQALRYLPDTSPKTIQTYLEGFIKRLMDLRVLSLEIAYDPTEETKAVLIAWIREFIGNDVIMELSVDRGLFGGARVSYEGRYKEIHLAAFIEQTLQEQQEIIDDIIKTPSTE